MILPIDNKILKDFFLLHLLFKDSQHGMQTICKLAVMLPEISKEEFTNE